MLNQRTGESTAELEKSGKLSARQRMDVIFDQGTFVETGAFVGSGDKDSADGYGAVITGYGSIDGYLVFAFAQDYSRLHGAMSVEQPLAHGPRPAHVRHGVADHYQFFALLHRK